MTDLYTKIVLTVIAAALVGIVTQQAIMPTAAAQGGGGCGDEKNPCRVALMTKIFPNKDKPDEFEWKDCNYSPLHSGYYCIAVTSKALP